MALTESSVRRVKIMMVVKTYPTPSARYGELVCTAGINIDTGGWMRIYPFPFRTAPKNQRFKKYDILELSVSKTSGEDKRPDSYRLMDIDSMRTVDHIGTDDGTWARRMQYLMPTAVDSLDAFKQRMLPTDGVDWGQSIGLVRCRRASAQLLVNTRRPEWTAEELSKLMRARHRLEQSLFATSEATAFFSDLKRIPYEFRLSFEDHAGMRYEHLILDWELGALYLKMAVRGEDAALDAVKSKVENDIFHPDRDVSLVIGSIHHRLRRRTALAIDGFVWPKAKSIAQPRIL